ncbi:MAG: ribosome biogenesis domain-containing protein, partial [Candidatus Nitrosomaritimum yanchengensis]
KFKWGHTFYELNHNILEEYSKIESEDDVNKILQDYGLAH